MKTIYFFLLVCIVQLFSTTTFSQTNLQSGLLTDFFQSRGKKVLQQWAHPLYPWFPGSTTISVGSGCVYVTNYYKGRMVDFCCSYKISVDNVGHFTDLEVYSEGNKVTPCYYVCDKSKDGLVTMYETDSKTKERMETQLGKAINSFNCKDLCLYGLFYYWKKDGYYNRY